tara:strand:+ start:1727 stop:2128 length:402 start_codon:yes stop_codon:yes gene_type:complete
MKNIFYKILILLTISGYAFADDPFSRNFTTSIINSANESSGYEGMGIEDGVHPMMRYPIENYIVKGVVISNEGSLAIISAPGSTFSEILFVGDPLGNDMHTIKIISNDFLIAGKNNGEDVSLSVSNYAMDVLN